MIDATDRSTRLRAFYASCVTSRGGSDDPRIQAAFAAIPRELFAGPGPWSIPLLGAKRRTYLPTPDDDPAFLYQDVLIALDPARGINIGEPSLHARCLDALALRENETVLQVGAGAGYYTAIMAHLVGPGGKIHAFEIDPDLAARASRNLAAWPWAQVELRSGAADDLPAADAIYVNAGITQPSPAWLEALREGGRLLFPLQPVGGYGAMLLVHKRDDAVWPARFVCRAGFIGCQAPQDDDNGRRLAQAFNGGAWDRVRSLRLTGTPDDTSWFDGGDWWLSTSEK
jgi:protein-L-isoaspartate(D-aspartate) O-methyltransferase